MATTHNLAVIIKNPSNESEFLLIKQTRPPKFNDPEYDSFQDSDLWDLPCAPLTPSLSAAADTSETVQGHESCSDMVNLSRFDLSRALNQVLGQVGIQTGRRVEWKFLKCMEEPEFGPGLPVKTVYLVGKLGSQNWSLNGICKWISIENCFSMLLDVQPSNDRVGHLCVVGILTDSSQSGNLNIPSTLRCQEYPPGVKLIPMGSRTTKPFRTTNLVVLLPEADHCGCGDNDFIAYGDALIVDPGCKSGFHTELKDIIAALPRKLVVFVTHHHHDHVDGLSVIQKCNPDASLLAHERTMRRISKDDWGLGYVPVFGTEEICIGGQQLRIISAPGHTDGHMALLHVSTNSLIVGDHCVGQGSSLLDITSGGNMREYFETTYKFMELSPHALIPMHGRVNLWPKHMLYGYLNNRRNRESAILKAIEAGARTLFDIVSYAYADVDRGLWIPAGSNVRLHVDHLTQQDKLPRDFSLTQFQTSSGLRFLSRWLWACTRSSIFRGKHQNVMLFGAVTVAGFAVLYTLRNKLNLK